MKQTSEKIFLIGFMGSGKSTLGNKLANKMRLPFYDLDTFIEEQVGMTITEMFNIKGEQYFRQLEEESLKKIIKEKDRCVIALGGGTPCFNNNIDKINKAGTSIYLKYNAGILTSRLINAKTKRPLIANKSKEELVGYIKEMLTKREPYYNKSNIIIEGKKITLNQVLALLL